MKKKLFILALVLSFFYTLIPDLSTLHAEQVSADVSNELPSNVFLQKEKRSLGADYGQSMLTTRQAISPFASDPWGGDPEGGFDDNPNGGGNGGWGNGNSGNVAGPIGDVTLPIIFSILILYLGYRRVSTSRRRNDI